MVFGFLQNIGPWQLIICLVVAFLLFGGKKIPELARSLGKAKGEFKRGLEEGEESAKELRKQKREERALEGDEPAKELKD